MAEKTGLSEKASTLINNVRYYWKKPAKGRYMSFKEIASYAFGGIGAYLIVCMSYPCILGATNVFLSGTIGIGLTDMYIMYVIAILSGIPLLFTQNQNDVYSGILYYCIANIFAVLPILLYGRKNRNLIVKSSYKLLIYIVLVLVSLSISKGIALMIINHDYLGFYKYFVSMIFTFSINAIIILLFRHFKSELLVDMNHYLLDASNEEKTKDPGFKIEEEKGEEKNEDWLKNERIENESNH